uniref:Uncharacterized protein n=1 Tax=Oryza sativa subsp. japonica TaxID=39947 RepID=Q53NI4_ORYSJ|nr:hypothetical protein LOC_Os11g08690 [Oryza sativa Japonica Group]
MELRAGDASALFGIGIEVDSAEDCVRRTECASAAEASAEVCIG